MSAVNLRFTPEVGREETEVAVFEDDDDLVLGLRGCSCGCGSDSRSGWDAIVVVWVEAGGRESMATAVEMEVDEVAESCDASGGTRRSVCVSEPSGAVGLYGARIGDGVIDRALLEEADTGTIVGSSSSPFLPKNFIRSICFPEYSAQNFDAILGGSRLPSGHGFTPNTSCNLIDTPSRLGSGISSRKSR